MRNRPPQTNRLLMFLAEIMMPEKYGRPRSRAKAAPGPPADLAERLKAGRARVAKLRQEREHAEQERKARLEGPA